MQRSIFKNTPTKSYLPSNDFIDGWKQSLEENGYVEISAQRIKWVYCKNEKEITIRDLRNEGPRKIDQYVSIQYRVVAPLKRTYITEDISLEEFEKKAETILNKLRNK